MKLPNMHPTPKPGADLLAGDTLLEKAASHLKQGDLETAQRVLDQALRRSPENRMAHLLLKQVLVTQGDLTGLRSAVERQLDYGLSPETVALNRSLVSLVLGDMPLGWEQYESRWSLPGLIIPERSFTQPRWEGQRFEGQTLLLHFEQGLGDTLMFVRYAPLAKALGGRVLLAAQVPLADLVGSARAWMRSSPTETPSPLSTFTFH